VYSKLSNWIAGSTPQFNYVDDFLERMPLVNTILPFEGEDKIARIEMNCPCARVEFGNIPTARRRH